MTRFISHSTTTTHDMPDNSARQREEIYRFQIIRLSDNKSAFSNRRPRKGSKFWDDSKFLVWDLQDNCYA